MEVKLTWSNLTIADAEKKALNNVPETAGVYRLSVKDDENFYVFYVGETINLREALIKHFTSETENPCIAINVLKESAFRYAEETDENIRKSVVRQCYYHYQPTCNLVLPDGSDDITANLTN